MNSTIFRKRYSLLIFSFLVLTFSVKGSDKSDPQLEISMVPDQNLQITPLIQAAIDSCSKAGGGTVYFPSGNYLTGGIHLKSNVTLSFEKGAVLKGSDNYLDYGTGKRSEGLINGDSLTNIKIIGEGVIDGVDCKNPIGEEGFRGPHAIRLTSCKNIVIRDIQIIRSGNWAINCRYCSNAEVENVKIRGGHDGLHTRFCDNFRVKGCDFRTGDDCFAGNDNHDFTISDCKINTSCNGFRLGCQNLVIENCKIWGPGEYKHLSQNRNNMLAAFVHFSPKDDRSQIVSGNWLVKNITIDNVDNVYRYNFENGLWQTGQPVSDIKFENIKASGVLKTFSILGDSARRLKLSIQNASFTERLDPKNKNNVFEGVKTRSSAFFDIERFGSLQLQDVSFKTVADEPVLFVNFGNYAKLEAVEVAPGSVSHQIILENVQKVERK